MSVIRFRKYIPILKHNIKHLAQAEGSHLNFPSSKCVKNNKLCMHKSLRS
jgi:hypothetical protein